MSPKPVFSLDLSGDLKETSPHTIMDQFFMPFHLYMPNAAAGRWLGFKVNKVEEVVLSRIILKYQEKLCEYMAQVFIHSSRESL
jgi:hypothetical protein